MSYEIPVGSLKHQAAGAIAYRAALAISRAGRALSLTVDPDLRCELSSPSDAIPSELVGTYRGEAPFTLERYVYEDLVEFKKQQRLGATT